jgi:iron complex outermembrane receptor protein
MAISTGDYLDEARAIDPNWPAPPTDGPFRIPQNGFGPLTHESGYPGGEVGKWQTKSDSMQDGIIVDTKYMTLTAEWDINEALHLQAIFSDWEQFGRQVVDFDGTEYIVTTDDINFEQENQTIELHLSGSHMNGRLSWLAGYYSLDEADRNRFYCWGMWEYAVPNIGPGDPAQYMPAIQYVRDTAALLGLVQTAGPPIATFNPITFITDDDLTASDDQDEAFFGEVSFGLTDRLEMTVGVRVSDKQGTNYDYTPTDAFRTADPQIRPRGDMFIGAIVDPNDDGVFPQPDLGTITTNKFALSYQVTDDMMVYGSYSEGFTQGGINNVNNVGLVELVPEVIENSEIGIRSDWLGGRLRFNASYFDATWLGMRVDLLFNDPSGNSLPFPYPTSEGRGAADGFEIDITWLPTDNLQLTAGIGAISTKYTFDTSTTFNGRDGIAPNSKFAYAPDNSASIGVNYNIPLSNGGEITLVGQYGWMDDYTRDAAYQRNHVDANGNIVLEPAYGILNARMVYEPAARNYSISLWGRNLGDEQYINGGFDTRNVWGYDFAVIGRSRELGLGLSFEF